MNLDRLYAILDATTRQFRKGAAIEGTPALKDALNEALSKPELNLGDLPGGVVDIFDMPHESEAPADLVKVDVHFMIVGVDVAKAARVKDELIALLASYPEQHRFRQGLSYIDVGAEIGDQASALRLFALGEALGLWKVITPAVLGIRDPQKAQALAARGFVMFSGFNPQGGK